MNNFFYPKLALNNIKKNSKTYFPYILTCIFSISMYYIMYSLSLDEGLSKISGGEAVKIILNLGIYVIGIFSVIFLFYTNSFLIKRRKKEFGLFNILGMEKKHISKVLFLENIFIGIFTIVTGLLVGILLYKLIFLFLLKLMNMEIKLGFNIYSSAILYTIILFGIIFILIFLNNFRQVHLTNPIELLKGGNVGEKEPKSKWLITLIGLISLGSGYYISVTTSNPLQSLYQFFIAVILVIIGTYLLFVSGSVTFLKILKKNKNYYYKPNHFISTSSMIYRMKQNSVGLANICILSTMVLVMLSTTVSMYFGIEDALRSVHPQNIIVTAGDISTENVNSIDNIIEKEIQKEDINVTSTLSYKYTFMPFEQSGNNFSSKNFNVEARNFLGEDTVYATFIPIEDYNKLKNTNVNLDKNEVLLYKSNEGTLSNNININDIDFHIKKQLEENPIMEDRVSDIGTVYTIVTSEDDIRNIEKSFSEKTTLSYYYGFDVSANSEKQINLTNSLNSSFKALNIDVKADGAEANRPNINMFYGSFLFLGLFLGVLFIIATVLIIYYKQISEGYEDRARFEIMQKVGMSKEEVKKSIKSQVLTVFFIPLIVATTHIVFAFNVINKLLVVANLNNTNLFIICTIGVILVFALLYFIVYSLTAKTYYKVVSFN